MWRSDVMWPRGTNWAEFEALAQATERLMPPLHARLVRLLLQVERGNVTPRYLGSDGEDHWFEVGGWQICAFDDCGDFDYVDCAISPEGDVLDFDEMQPSYSDDAEWFLSAASYGGGWLGCSHDRWQWNEISRYGAGQGRLYRDLPQD